MKMCPPTAFHCCLNLQTTCFHPSQTAFLRTSRTRPRASYSLRLPRAAAALRNWFSPHIGNPITADEHTNTSTHPPLQSDPDVEVELRNVYLSFGNKSVLKNLNLKVRRGEATAIIGVSGTGKSTTLRLITGLALPDSGDVILRGWRREKLVEEQKSEVQVSMVFQSAALFDSLTVGENVGFALLDQRKLSEEQIYDLVQTYLERVGLRDVIDKYPAQLSGGMRKRVSFARAIIYDPEDPDSAPDIMLYDEPTAGLDPTASTRIEDIIRDLQQVCPTCIIVTHQFSTIFRTADRVVFLHDGSIVWDGPVELLSTTDNIYVRQFMSASLEGPLSVE